MENQNLLFSVYGARLSKSKKRVNISVVNGEGEDSNKKVWGTISIELNGKGKTQAKIKDGFAYIKVPMLKDLPKKEAKDEPKSLADDEIPF